MESHTLDTDSLRLANLFAFFLPLAGSALLVTLSHVIINSTLARSANPELVISTYAIAISLYAVIERPVLMFRQTSSALVKDQASYYAMMKICFLVIGIAMVLSGLIAYTPIGKWIFTHLFGVTEERLNRTIDVYQILMYVTVFSGVRCLFQGIIISHQRTKWMTVGMIIRLAGMVLIAWYYMTVGVSAGAAGAIIFLVGMAIECIVSIVEGIKLGKALPSVKEGHSVTRSSHVMTFYRPLMFASFFAVTIGPAINSLLNRTTDVTLAIASYSVALTVGMLFFSYASYIHQIVLNFYGDHPKRVLQFVLINNFLPALGLGLLAYTPLGPWVLEEVIGVSGDLQRASLYALRAVVLYALIFPWLDFTNGIIMLKGNTKVMSYTQIANVTTVLITMSLMLYWKPDWNGAIGSLSLSFGALAELAFAAWITLRMLRAKI